MKFFLLGDVVNRCELEIDPSLNFMEMLEEYCGGMKDNMRIKYALVGGPLGRFLEGRELYSPVSSYMDEMETPAVLFLSENFCPVDYVKFLTRYIQSQLQVNTGDVQVMRDLAENLVSPEGEEEDYLKLLRHTERESSSSLEKRFKEYLGEFLLKHSESFRIHYRDKRCPGTICRRMFDAQCINACPAEVNIPGYIELMEHGSDEDAYTLMKRTNPLSFVCGKICPRPCEKRCKRGELEQTVGVRALQRYAAEMSIEGYKEERAKEKGKKVAIIGAGPAGLTSAYFLGKTGYDVTVYDAHNKPGGMLAAGIPEYRLPQNTIDAEVKLIEDLGVEFKYGLKVGKDIDLATIREESDAVLLATGCQIGNKIQGFDVDKAESAVDFLKEVRLDGRTQVGKNVLVVGGGDVAMDALRTALRLGAKASVVSLESYEKMPASIEEKEEAQEEGAVFFDGLSVVSIKDKEATLKNCISILDKDFNFDPRFGHVTTSVKCDHIIFAIGQRADNSYFTEDIKEKKPGVIEQYRGTTTARGVFVAGDMVKVDTAVTAIADGRRVAEKIDTYLGGNGLYLGREVEIPNVPLNPEIWNTGKSREVILTPEKRRDNFKEICEIFSKDEAKCEALRCMRCDRNSRKRY